MHVFIALGLELSFYQLLLILLRSILITIVGIFLFDISHDVHVEIS